MVGRLESGGGSSSRKRWREGRRKGTSSRRCQVKFEIEEEKKKRRSGRRRRQPRRQWNQIMDHPRSRGDLDSEKKKKMIHRYMIHVCV